MNNLWKWKTCITEPKSDVQCDRSKSVAKPNPGKTVNQVVNQDITDPNSHDESTVAKPNHDEQLDILVVNKDIAEPNSHEKRDINSKSTGVKPKSRQKVTKVLGKEGEQDVKSVQRKKTTARKAVAKGRKKVGTKDQGENMSAKQPHTNRKSEEEEHDN